MKLTRIILHTVLQIPYGFRRLTGTGSFGPNRARYISGPVSTDSNGLKEALFRHHVKQYHESSCSVASVVSVVNAIRAMTERNTPPAPVDQMEILEKVKTGNWKARMSRGGDNGRRGLPLALLGEVVKSSLDAYGIGYRFIDTVHASKRTGASVGIKRTLRRRLRDFEEKGDGVIVAHFDQGMFVPALNIPHISPVGGFDPRHGGVTILDVDPDQELHYRISFDTFYKGLASNYHQLFRPFGYGSGGYVYIKLNG